MASIELDLPEPLGPMMEVKYASPNSNVWWPLYDLKSVAISISSLMVAMVSAHTEQLKAHKLAHIDVCALKDSQLAWLVVTMLDCIRA